MPELSGFVRRYQRRFSSNKKDIFASEAVSDASIVAESRSGHLGDSPQFCGGSEEAFASCLDLLLAGQSAKT